MLLVQMTLLLAVAVATLGLVLGNHELLITMPNVSPHEEVHLDHAIKLDPHRSIYIRGFSPQFQYGLHMIVIACSEPFSFADVWSGTTACKDSDYIIFTSSKDGSIMQYPEGVGLQVGGDSGLLYIVLQMHYTDMKPFQDGAFDRTALTVFYTTYAPLYLAGQLLLDAGGYIQPGDMEYFESAVVIDEDVVLHPFTYRVHTHILGLVVVAYRVRDGRWTEIGRRSPQLPQIYVPAKPVTLRKGDIVAARCTHFNFKDHVVQMEEIIDEDMCRFFMMYYVDGGSLFSKSIVISEGPPKYYWRLDERLNATNIPADASEIPLSADGSDPDHVEHMEHKHV